MPLKEIAAIGKERRGGGISSQRRLEILRAQLVRLEAKAAEMSSLASYLRAKIAWLTAGEKTAPPNFSHYLAAPEAASAGHYPPDETRAPQASRARRRN
jgi:hypothetical protein